MFEAIFLERDRTARSFAVVASPEDKRLLHDLAFDIEIEYGVVVSLLVRTPAEYVAMDGSQLDRELERGITVG